MLINPPFRWPQKTPSWLTNAEAQSIISARVAEIDQQKTAPLAKRGFDFLQSGASRDPRRLAPD